MFCPTSHSAPRIYGNSHRETAARFNSRRILGAKVQQSHNLHIERPELHRRLGPELPDCGPMSRWRAYSCWPGETSTAPGSGGNASVKVDPYGPVCTATVPLFACATPPTMASPSPAPG